MGQLVALSLRHLLHSGSASFLQLSANKRYTLHVMARRKVHPTFVKQSICLDPLHVMARRKVHPTNTCCRSHASLLHVMAKRKVHPTGKLITIKTEELHVMAKRKVHPTRDGSHAPLSALHVMARRKVHPTRNNLRRAPSSCMSWQKERYIQLDVVYLHHLLSCMSCHKE